MLDEIWIVGFQTLKSTRDLKIDGLDSMSIHPRMWSFSPFWPNRTQYHVKEALYMLGVVLQAVEILPSFPWPFSSPIALGNLQRTQTTSQSSWWTPKLLTMTWAAMIHWCITHKCHISAKMKKTPQKSRHSSLSCWPSWETAMYRSSIPLRHSWAPCLHWWIWGCSKYQTHMDWMHMAHQLSEVQVAYEYQMSCLCVVHLYSWYLVFWGSLLIIIYVVGIFFVIMNLFYAIIVSTLSDAKIEEDAKQKKKWAVMRDRLEDTWKAGRKHVMWRCFEQW